MSEKKRHLKITLSKAKKRVKSQLGGNDRIEHRRSLGELRKANKTKPRSPDVTGKLRLQRHTLQAIIQDFKEADGEEVICNIAGWKNHDQRGSYLTVFHLGSCDTISKRKNQVFLMTCLMTKMSSIKNVSAC